MTLQLLFFQLFPILLSQTYMADEKQLSKKEKKRNFMSRNVTEFRHLIKSGIATENDLNWVINLRENLVTQTPKPQESSPPEVYFKKTKITIIRNENRSKQQHFEFLPSDLGHMILKGQDHDKQTEQQLHFYAQLRRGSSQKQQLRQKDKDFDTIPFKERQESPKFIKKGCIKKLRMLTIQDKEPGLDGAHKQNPYTQKILKNRNYGYLENFTRLHGRSQVSLPSLAWQVGLRDYR